MSSGNALTISYVELSKRRLHRHFSKGTQCPVKRALSTLTLGYCAEYWLAESSGLLPRALGKAFKPIASHIPTTVKAGFVASVTLGRLTSPFAGVVRAVNVNCSPNARSTARESLLSRAAKGVLIFARLQSGCAIKRRDDRPTKPSGACRLKAGSSALQAPRPCRSAAGIAWRKASCRAY